MAAWSPQSWGVRPRCADGTSVTHLAFQPCARIFGTFGEGHPEQRERRPAERCLRGRRSRRTTAGHHLGRVCTARGVEQSAARDRVFRENKIGQILTTSSLRVVAFGRSVTRAALMMPAPRAWVREATPSQKRFADAASSVDSTGSKSTRTSLARTKALVAGGPLRRIFAPLTGRAVPHARTFAFWA